MPIIKDFPICFCLSNSRKIVCTEVRMVSRRDFELVHIRNTCHEDADMLGFFVTFLVKDKHLCSSNYNIYEVVTSLLLVIRLCEIRTHALPTKVGKTPVKPTKKLTIDRDGGKKSKDKGELHFFRQQRPTKLYGERVTLFPAQSDDLKAFSQKLIEQAHLRENRIRTPITREWRLE
ncbi:hypothetical protein J3Q64DRAFT_1692432 [Phycomyces blakesleeanus]|uniref:Uncharacterized protein n=2 Tax=Phycomyces blakesleeanus TaxID=4837 RepID=A0A167PHI5_PHYB8|nr:hypothetical protein PHYBLDRAFT_164801 [Phycomyces blakesleeanus NRRL 1555(-)]XP_018296019.1 hypothetical protein PHYBLDRAFT_164859 [Phycomyces blakesleeanus NRRL 1555(-)]OAD77919.1 hypothetical protein PHYBLDRAFT_164801 [Phycomyces blakesleeanus NRRL 1555(-)]OAD77979.1 hypothetical protein PHYBLDRAFT_164859 [Phycomyces blakesleeanus NRRL 1555(-)]|eukprot:XP_018295959.1 hypothetical protein PHYBLDRAFT_164801 [Phycomyces blakesleeanus NRRL 1555(-)]